jgi:hypothetical protein
VSHNHSHIIGSNITSISANTTHVERFNIGTIDNNESLNDVLVRDTDGTVRYRSSQSIADSFTGDTFVTGGTYSSGIATFTNNIGGTFNVTGFTDTFVIAGIFNDTTNTLSLLRNDGNFVNITGVTDTFTGNTSGDCITDLYVTNLYGCSPLHIEPSGLNDVYIVENGGNVGIGTTNPQYKLEVNGSFGATSKSFDIPHPTKEGKRLRYGSLEGPEYGVYVRGKLSGENIIELPEHWSGLVDENDWLMKIQLQFNLLLMVENKIYLLER